MKRLTFDENQALALNNLFHPSGRFNRESLDEIEIKCIRDYNKQFLPIILKESLALLKKNGILKFYYSPKRDGLSMQDVEGTMWWLFKRDCIILTHHTGVNSLLKIKKNIQETHRDDDIDKWTFGMVTNGVRKEFIESSISSIRELKIPHYEIIICGYYPEHSGSDIVYIEFTERDDLAWITRKKNIIAENAKYNNMCIFHDRIIFNKDWYKGMKKYGNNFELLGCVQVYQNIHRAGDWVSTNIHFSDPGFSFRIEQLDYRDWNRYVYIGGQLIILKKYVWEKEPWNETLYWNQSEDIEYSCRLIERGYIPRFNTFSSCTPLSWRYGRIPAKLFSRNVIHHLRHSFLDVPFRRLFRIICYCMFQIFFLRLFLNNLFLLFSKTKIYKYIKEH